MTGSFPNCCNPTKLSIQFRDKSAPLQDVLAHMQTRVSLEHNDEFTLYDLKVEVVLDGRQPVCRHLEGEFFTVEGENLVFSAGQKVSMYALAAVLPLLPAKQRDTDPCDWMSTDAEVACPDPNCGGRFRITRIGKRRFSHAETTGLPDARSMPYWQRGED